MKGHGRYVLDVHGEPVFEPDLMAWAYWFEKNFLNRRVGRTEIGPYTVSTVFLGVDHNWSEDGPPLLWESMVFGPAEENGVEDSLEMDRCSGNREQAEAMHAAMVERLEALLALNA